MPRAPERTDGYLPISDYAVIGNERTAALVGLDGSIDWLCLPTLESPSTFGAILDARSGGRYALAPAEPFQADRAYLEESNVLTTTFRTGSGAVKVTDAMTLPEIGPLPWDELVRKVECVEGEVEMEWSVEPRFQWGKQPGTVETRQGVPTVRCGPDLMTVHAWDAGDPELSDGRIAGGMPMRAGDGALLGLSAFHDDPLLLSSREDVERRLEETDTFWRDRAARVEYDGPWRDAVVRSALALQLLIYRDTGAIAAAPTTSLPEKIGGERNYDYRFAWLRDMSFTLEAMLRLGYRDQVHASLSWILSASRSTHPRLTVFYELDGESPRREEELELDGYRGSRPVVAGNAAVSQLQLDNYADVLQTAWLYVEHGKNSLDPSSGVRLAEVADFVTEVWRNPDSSVWELPRLEDYTHGKLAAWLALDRAIRLAEAGELPDDRVERWRGTADEVRRFVEERCWSEERSAYLHYYGGDGLDAAVLLLARRSARFFESGDPRLHSTIEALREELQRGPLMYRYSGMEDQEGAFLACSFWLVEALAYVGRNHEARELMDELVALGNDVGLYSEEMDPESGEMLGNFPQALTHLALVNAAYALREGED